MERCQTKTEILWKIFTWIKLFVGRLCRLPIPKKRGVILFWGFDQVYWSPFFTQYIFYFDSCCWSKSSVFFGDCQVNTILWQVSLCIVHRIFVNGTVPMTSSYLMDCSDSAKKSWTEYDAATGNSPRCKLNHQFWFLFWHIPTIVVPLQRSKFPAVSECLLFNYWDEERCLYNVQCNRWLAEQADQVLIWKVMLL